MTLPEFSALLPFVILAAAPVAILIAAAVRQVHAPALGWAAAGIFLSLVPLLGSGHTPRQVTPLLWIDGYGRFVVALLLMSGLFTLLLSSVYPGLQRERREEFCILILTSLLGAACLACASHFATLLLGLELLSVSLYALIAYRPGDAWGGEAGIKYLVLAAFSSAFLAFGSALLYAALGTMQFSALGAKLAAAEDVSPLVLAGTALVAVGIGFKLAVVPFHMWVADVYQGAPAPVTAFVATVSKGAVFAFLLRFFLQAGLPPEHPFAVFFMVVAVASMVAGNLLALRQDNVKRLLAYSSIAHMGTLLVALLAGGPLRVPAALFYLAAYVITTLGAFGVVTVLSGALRDADRIEDYRGLFYRRPWLAGIFTAMLLSLAGIPLTAGFIGKFYVLAAGVGSLFWLPVLTLIVMSAVGLFYYLRLISALYTPADLPGFVDTPIRTTGRWVLAILTLLLIVLGIYPNLLLELIVPPVLF